MVRNRIGWLQLQLGLAVSTARGAFGTMGDLLRCVSGGLLNALHVSLSLDSFLVDSAAKWLLQKSLAGRLV